LPALFDPLRGRLVTSHSTKESSRPSAVGYRPKADILTSPLTLPLWIG